MYPVPLREEEQLVSGFNLVYLVPLREEQQLVSGSNPLYPIPLREEEVGFDSSLHCIQFKYDKKKLYLIPIYSDSVLCHKKNLDMIPS